MNKKDIIGFDVCKRPRHGTGLSQKTLGKCLKIFYETKFFAKKKITYYSDIAKKSSYFEADWCLEEKKLIYEYDGPDHYNNVFKIDRDKRKKKELENQNYKIVIVPFYVQLTKDIAKHYFENKYTEEKYYKAIKMLYGANKESEILAPGWHKTKHTIANFVNEGIDIFLNQIDKFPPSLKSQVKYSLDLYIRDSNERRDLIVPRHHEKLNDFMKFQPNINDYCNLVYLREDMETLK